MRRPAACRYVSNNARRRRNEARMAGAIVAAIALGFAALIYSAAQADAARGISAGESLAAWGL